jgi:adenosylhomocysteine nucleosidase
MRIGIIAAMPGELKPLVRGWPKMPVARGSGIAMWQRERYGDEVVAVCAGMGSPAARRAFTAAEFAGSLDMVLSVGWAGALTETAKPGECYVVSEVIDTLTGERFNLHEALQQRLVTADHVADEREKHRLATGYGAQLVDMEASAVARLAQMRDIPMHCVKAVSDGVGMNLPSLNPFIDIDGKLKMPAFLGYVALRPQYWSPLLELGRNSAAGARAMARTVEHFLAFKDFKPMGEWQL